VCPGTGNDESCCSSIWWSSDENAREERRVAYVAMTRTRGDLILWIGSPSFDRLRILRPEFVNSLEQLSVEQTLTLFR